MRRRAASVRSLTPMARAASSILTLAAGMQLPDPADPGLDTLRVVRGT